MKTKKLLSLFLLSISMTGYCATVTITATNSVMTFSNPDVTINFGDIVHFTLGSIHSALEISESTYNSPPVTLPALPGGFHVSFGGDQDVTGLSIGTHWYGCENHAYMGMVGKITVMALGVNDFQLVKNFVAFPNPATDSINIKVNDGSFGLPFSIMDEQGRMVSTGKLADITTSIDLRQLNGGIYFLQVGNDKRQTFKLIKK